MDSNVFCRCWTRLALLLVAISSLVLGASNARAAQSVTLIWNASADTNVIGYNVYYGVASRTYTNRIDAGATTNLVVNGLLPGVTYYFAATAYNILGMESEYSSEVSYTVPVPVNTPPTLDSLPNLNIVEDFGLRTVQLSGISSGSASEVQSLIVTASSSNPSLIPHPVVTYTSSQTAGSLSFTPVANGFGTATITVTVDDGAGTNRITTRSFLVTVSAVNDTPTLNAISAITINEDAAAQTVALSGISSGAANEAQVLVVSATSSNPSLIPNPTVSYGSPAAAGSLTFSPVANAFGNATISVTVNDGSANVTRTFVVTVNAVNDSPTLNSIANLSVPQNAETRIVNLAGISSGAPNENQTLVVSAASSNPGLIPTPDVSYASPSASGTLTFTPVTGASGTATITVTVNDGGGNNSSVSRSFVVSVAQVNQVPTLEPLANLSIPENAGQRIVQLNGISSGSSTEVQTLTITASSSNTNLIATPVVTYTSPDTTGTLRFSPATNAHGTSTITVSVRDGGLSNNIVTRSFTVTVYPVNTPPTLQPLANLVIPRNSGQQTVNLAGISSGAANETQVLSVNAVSSVPGIIPNPTVSYSSPAATGKLTFSPQFLATGTTLITVTVNDNAGSNNIVQRSFSVTVTAPPTISDIPDQLVGINSNTAPIAFTVASADVDLGALTITATSTAPGLIPTTNIVFAGTGAARTVRLMPIKGQYGKATITISVSDGVATSSTSFVLEVVAPPSAPGMLMILTAGDGTVSGAKSGQPLVAGKVYSLTAVPAKGQEFAGWSGSFSSSATKIRFTARSNMVVQANFVPSPYRTGVYSGLIHEEEGIRVGSSGMFNLVVANHGRYSGRIQVGTTRVAFSGKLDLQCRATNIINRPGIAPMVLTLQMGEDATVDQVFGMLEGSVNMVLRGDRSVFNRTNPAPFAGNYTMVLPGSETSGGPEGHGHGIIKVNALGKAMFAGLLGDGTKVTQSAALSKDGTWPFFAALNRGQGAVISWLQFTNRINDDISGTVYWVRNAAQARYFPSGISHTTEAMGSRYTAIPGTNVLNSPVATIGFFGGNLEAPVQNALEISPLNQVLNLSTNAIALRFAPGSGLFSGKVSVPGQSKPLAFSGVVLQKQGVGYGFMLGTDSLSAVELNGN
ncbi:MAG TPA: tandem-95 repeat protein [Verrucomicrobiae bacterium]|nr:tandem-95 repeat protein [Verrucomicrobiae bacterium]